MSSPSSSSPRRQRRALYRAHPFQRRIRMTVPLSRELRARFHQRSLPLRKGDTVRVLSGSFAGREERVARVDRRAYTVTLDNVTLKAADEKLKPLSLKVGHLVITRLNLSDPWRRRSLKVREEDVTPEERGETPEPEEEETTSGADTAPAPATAEKSSDEEETETPEPPAEAPARASKKASDDEEDADE